MSRWGIEGGEVGEECGGGGTLRPCYKRGGCLGRERRGGLCEVMGARGSNFGERRFSESLCC